MEHWHWKLAHRGSQLGWTERDSMKDGTQAQAAERFHGQHHYCARMLSYLSRVQLFATLWTVTRQVPLSVGLPRQEYWSGLPCPPLGDLSNPGIELTSPEAPALQANFFFITEPSGEAHYEDYGIGKTWLIQGGDWLHCRNDWSSSRLSKAVGMIHGDVVALTRTLFTQGALKPPSEWWEGRCTPTRLVDVCRNSQVISFWMKIFISIWTLECGLCYNRDFLCCVTDLSPAPKTVLST